MHGIDLSSSLRLLPFEGCLLFTWLGPYLSGNKEKSEKWEYPPYDADLSRGFGGFNNSVFSGEDVLENVDAVAAFDFKYALSWACFTNSFDFSLI